MKSAKSPVLAFLLSLIVPGLGHFYLGRTGRAIGTILGTIMVLPLLFVVLGPFMAAAALNPLWLVGAWWLGAAGEAAMAAQRMARCPYCTRIIDRRATVCPYCTRSVAD